MRKVKLFALVLAVLMAVSVFSGCSLGGGKASVYADIDEDGRFIYSVIRSSEASTTVEDAAKSIRAAMKDNFDCSITITKDNAYEDFDFNYEILVGNTTREESELAKDILKENRLNNASDFIVAVMDDKIVINAMTDNMVAVAAEWFVHNFCQSLDTWANLKEDYQFIYAPEKSGATNTVCGVDIGIFTVVRPHKMSFLPGFEMEAFIEHYSNIGYDMAYVDDKEPATDYEILLGDTTRPESGSVSVDGDNYIVKVIGTKVVIKGGNDLATWRGVKAFADTVYAAEASGTALDMADGYVINGKYDAAEEGAYTLNFGEEFETGIENPEFWRDYYYNASFDSSTKDSALGGKLYQVNTLGETKYEGGGLPKLIYQADGKLNLGTAKVNDTDFVGSHISTFWSMIYKYGCLEISAKAPASPASLRMAINGAGTDGEEFKERFGDCTRVAYSEMDLFENNGSLNSFTSNIHRWWKEYNAEGTYTGNGHNTISSLASYAGASDNNVKFNYDKKVYGDDLSNDFHTYSFYWDNGRMKFAFDGKTFLDYKYLDNMSVSLHCLANYLEIDTFMGSASEGKIYNSLKDPELCETQIDYIRIYQTSEQNSQMVFGWPPKQSGERKVVYPDHEIGKYY